MVGEPVAADDGETDEEADELVLQPRQRVPHLRGVGDVADGRHCDADDEESQRDREDGVAERPCSLNLERVPGEAGWSVLEELRAVAGIRGDGSVTAGA
jgi:hypothetical protein